MAMAVFMLEDAYPFVWIMQLDELALYVYRGA